METLRKIDTKLMIKVITVMVICVGLIGNLELVQMFKELVISGEISGDEVRTVLIYCLPWIIIMLGIYMYAFTDYFCSEGRFSVKNLAKAILASFIIIIVSPGLVYFPYVFQIKRSYYISAILGMYIFVFVVEVVKKIPRNKSWPNIADEVKSAFEEIKVNQKDDDKQAE